MKNCFSISYFYNYTILTKWVKYLGSLHRHLKVRRIDEYTSLLAISYLETEHAGNYSCVATNSVAEYVRSAVLTIRGKSFFSILFESGFLLHISPSKKYRKQKTIIFIDLIILMCNVYIVNVYVSYIEKLIKKIDAIAMPFLQFWEVNGMERISC